MKKVTQEDWDDVLAHWRANVAAALADKHVETAANRCAFCMKFMLPVAAGVSCKGCPVYEETKETFCHGAPYYTVQACLYDMRPSRVIADACLAELKFLEGLYEKWRKTNG